MRAINWIRVLTSAGIEYVERGPNVKRGEINIRCPFCGQADPSHHLGLNLDNGWWACWRNQSHRGKSPVRLLVKLLRCTYHRACEIAGIGADYIDPDGFDIVAARIMQRDGLSRVEEVRRDFLAPPSNDLAPVLPYGRSNRHYDYLVHERGFRHEDIPLLMSKYGIAAGVHGEWSNRIYMPFFVGGELVTWTARAIAEAKIRYKDLRLEDSLIPPKKTLYNHDALIEGGDYLLVVEGPFDALKLDCYGFEWGVRAVALSTNSIQEDQIYLIEEASSNFKRTLIMMDNAGARGVVDSLHMQGKFAQVQNAGFMSVPFGKKDGGELSPREVVAMARSLQ